MMRLRVILFIIGTVATFSLVNISVWSANPLTITTPNGEKIWNSGETQTIKWNEKDWEGYVKLELFHEGELYETIKRRTTNDGQFRWVIPLLPDTDAGYEIRIQSVEKAKGKKAKGKKAKGKKAKGKKAKNSSRQKKTSSKKNKLIMAAGDISECNNENSARTAEIIERYPNATVITMGDNAYKDGSKKDFECYDRTWGKFKDRTNPTLGNHEYRTTNARAYFKYFGRRAGQRGKGYYSFKVGEWQLIALNSNCNKSGAPGCAEGSAQYQWLKETLSKSTSKCTIVYMHHPWLSSGGHGSAIQVKHWARLFYHHNVDIVLGGHDHMYERHAKQNPDGRIDKERGMRQFVVGTGGRALKTQEKLRTHDRPLKNSETWNRKTHGVLKLSLGEGNYRWEFIPVKKKKYRDEGVDVCH